jgi:hypothetical protein
VKGAFWAKAMRFMAWFGLIGSTFRLGMISGVWLAEQASRGGGAIPMVGITSGGIWTSLASIGASILVLRPARPKAPAGVPA